MYIYTTVRYVIYNYYIDKCNICIYSNISVMYTLHFDVIIFCTSSFILSEYTFLNILEIIA